MEVVAAAEDLAVVSNSNQQQIKQQFVRLSLIVLVAVTVSGLGGCASLSALKTSKTSDEKKDAQLSLARLSERRDDSVRAKQLYTDILANDPENAIAHHRLGVIYAKEGLVSEALASLSEAARLDEDSSEILTDIGYVYYLNGNFKKAEASLRKSLAITPTDERTTNNLALVCGRDGKYAESFRLFRRVNTQAEAYANVSYVMTQNGDYDKATDGYHRALDKDAELRHAANALVQLSEARPDTLQTNEQLAKAADAGEGRTDERGVRLASHLIPINKDIPASSVNRFEAKPLPETNQDKRIDSFDSTFPSVNVEVDLSDVLLQSTDSKTTQE